MILILVIVLVEDGVGVLEWIFIFVVGVEFFRCWGFEVGIFGVECL